MSQHASVNQMDRLLDAAAMDRIIAAVGAEPANRENLRRRLLRLGTSYEAAILWRQTNKSLRERLDQIARTAERLRTQLDDERAWLEIQANDGLPDDKLDLREIGGLLDRVIDAASKPLPTDMPVLAPIAPVGQEQHLQEGSSFEWLIGELGKLFKDEMLFKQLFSRQKYTKDPVDGEIKGAFIDFVDTVLRELSITNKGQPYTRAAIASALTLANSGKPRR